MPKWRKTGQMAFQKRADLQNPAVGWLRKGCRSLGGGTVVRFPRIWMSSGECRFKPPQIREKLIKIGAKVVRHGRYIIFQLAEVAISRALFAEILRLIDRLRPAPLPP